MNKFLNWLVAKQQILLFALTLVGVFVLLYVNLGRDTLFHWDEGIYAELGRSILHGSGSIITPSWNHEVWLEKPPAIAWITALSMSLFGINEFGARALMPVFALLTLVFVYLIGTRLKNWQLGQISMSLLATFNLFLSRSRAVNTDGILLFALTSSFYFALIKATPAILALTLSIGIFAKGIAGLLIVMLVSPLILKNGFKYAIQTAIYYLLIIVPWHLYQLIVNKSLFYTPYLLEQVIKRATVPIEFHMESRWYYFEFLKENLSGGILYILVIAIVYLVFQTFIHKKLSRESILLWWLALPLIIFTLAKTRLYWYILPIYPAIALLVGYLFTSFTGQYIGKLRSVLIIGLSLQAILSVATSVEIKRTLAKTPDDIKLAQTVQTMDTAELFILVPESERVAEAILPLEQRIGSSFRYGGSPSLVFYSQKKVTYYYNVDEWIESLENSVAPTLFAVDDLPRLPKGYVVYTLSGTHALAVKGEDVVR